MPALRFLSIHPAWSRISTLALLLALGGCANQTAKPPAPEPPPAPVIAAAPKPPAPQPLNLPAVIALLEGGDFKAAHAQLQQAVAAEPGNLAARQLFAQLNTDPNRYFGSAHTSHTVQAGESMAGLARQYLGHPLEFVALARYNNIARPRWLEVGQTLKIPSGYRSPLAAASRVKPATSGANAAADVAVLDRDWPPAYDLDVVTVGERYRERIDALIKAQRFDEASTTVADARKRQAPGDAWTPWLNPLEARANALLWQQRGMAQLELASMDSRQRAYEAFGNALALIPTLEPARAQRQTLRQALVLDYHEAAIVQYRNQQLDAALTLWDKALALDPQFAPAQGYRTRAVELKRRLQNLEAGLAVPEPPTPETLDPPPEK